MVVKVYIWIVYWGALCMQEGGIEIIHRCHCYDIILFQLILKLLDHFLMKTSQSLLLSISATSIQESVR